MAGTKKKAQREGRKIVFIDESGLSERPHRVRTWAPRGETPQLTFSFNWKNLSLIAGITVWNFYFRFYPGTVRAPQVVNFLKHLRRHLRSKLLIIWDGNTIHRAALVRNFLESTNGRIVVAKLPAYAPELNPAEYIFGYLKERELGNFCPNDLKHLSLFGRRALKRMKRKTKIINACWQQASLF